jgi:hypothetical protein
MGALALVAICGLCWWEAHKIWQFGRPKRWDGINILAAPYDWSADTDLMLDLADLDLLFDLMREPVESGLVDAAIAAGSFDERRRAQIRQERAARSALGYPVNVVQFPTSRGARSFAPDAS